MDVERFFKENCLGDQQWIEDKPRLLFGDAIRRARELKSSLVDCPLAHDVPYPVPTFCDAISIANALIILEKVSETDLRRILFTQDRPMVVGATCGNCGVSHPV